MGFSLILGSQSTPELFELINLRTLYTTAHEVKKPDFAQVTIRFDNTDHKLPLELDEVEISRKVRLTKTGYNSYFYFNGKAVTLGEIHFQLAKAGITPEGYNVVMQGDVTQIISMTSVERRKIIDEIAGVAGI